MQRESDLAHRKLYQCFRIALEMEGYEIFEARSAEQAVDILAEHSFALAILDMRLPGMDGLELLAKMRERGNSVPAMIVTACGDPPHAVKAMKLGAIDFLQKPLRPAELRNIVDEIVKRHAGSDDSLFETFAAHIASAKRYLRAFAKTRLHLVKALELNPRSVEALNLAGVLAELLQYYGKAKKYYAQAIKLDKSYYPAQENMRRLFEVDQFGSSKEPINLGDDWDLWSLS